MKDAALAMLKQLAGSKKFAGLVVGIVAVVLVKVGLEEGAAKGVSEQLVALVCAYLVGQGIADHGKEKEKEAKA